MANRQQRRATAKQGSKSKSQPRSTLISRSLSFPLPSVTVSIEGSDAQYAMNAVISQAMEIIEPADVSMTDPDTGTVININTSPEGIISHLISIRDDLLKSGIDRLKDHQASIGGINAQQLLLMGVVDTCVSSIDHICSLVKQGHWNSIPHVARAILDAYLIYDGIFYSKDPLEYIEDLKRGVSIHDHESVCGSDLTYTHIAEMASQKYPPISDLFSWHSSQHHYSLDALQRLVWNSGEPMSVGSNRLKLAIGESKGNFDQKAYAICCRVFQILEYSSFMGKPLTPDQIDAAKKATAVRKAAQKQHKADVKKARQDRIAARPNP